MIKKRLGQLFFGLMGWKLDARIQPEMKHSLMIAAPHTTNWDFVYTMAAFWAMGMPFKYFIKDSYTKSIMGWFFHWTGAIGVDRSQRSNLVQHAINLFREREELVILITPEGSRSWAEKWKLGFYHIATGAQVPLTLAYIDYEKKIAGVARLLYPSGNLHRDLDELQEFYRDFKGKFPENYSPKIH